MYASKRCITNVSFSVKRISGTAGRSFFANMPLRSKDFERRGSRPVPEEARVARWLFASAGG